MSYAAAIIELDRAAPSKRDGSIVRRILRDLAIVAGLATVSTVAGFAINRLSSRPLPFGYQTPEQRLDHELTTLVTSAPFSVSPAATVGLASFRSAVESKNAINLEASTSFCLARRCSFTWRERGSANRLFDRRQIDRPKP